MNVIQRFLGRSLTTRLFSYFSAALLLILSVSTVIELMVIESLLMLPHEIKHEFRDLAVQADEYLEEQDLNGLRKWEEIQNYTLFVVDANYKSVTSRDVHPHIEFKMSISRHLEGPMGETTSKPMISLDLSHGHHLMIQLPWQLHPAEKAKYYLWGVRVLVAASLLGFISWLLSSQLQKPLKRLQTASHRLAEGDLSVRVSDTVQTDVREFLGLAHDFDHMAHRVESLVMSHKQLLRNVSHELRTPLARQTLAMHLLKSRLTPEQMVWFSQIENDVDEMNNLIQQILEFSRLESSHYQTSLIPTELDPLLRMIIEELALQAGDNQSIEYVSHCKSGWVLGDRGLINSVVQNAISNSFKYAGEDCRIEISIYEQDNGLVIQISDDGVGVSEQDLPHLFEPFSRIDDTRGKDVEGYGLGMSIMKLSMEQMGGSIRVCSQKDKGFTLYCWLPAFEGNNHTT
ncbi:sensor histidine kinase [Vibrio sp. Of7-15]|uniref:sensor histidine kinase n=1 Tax=Vibrio sp. Of7-15 TaxID=2724879 RepID=UPI001EF28421|nr:sensor histidine kinase [Vibrio sp. Of7-15]MCG7496013.1 sensor histidine kinase [Vibrio sp. Of7-15]